MALNRHGQRFGMKKFGFNVTLGATLLALAACGSHEQAQPLKITLPGSFAKAKSAQSAPNYAYRWWLGFGDETLNQLIAIGLAESPTATLAAARLREAEARAQTTRNWPLGSGEVRGRRSDGVGTEELELDAEWNFFGGRQAARSAALERLEAAGYGEDSARLSLVSELAQAYVELRYLQQTRVLRDRDLRSRQRTVNSLLELSDAGNATRLDVVRARALVEETRAEIPEIAASITAQKNRIATLSGRALARLGVDLGYKGIQPAAQVSGRIGVPADLVRGKPEVRQAEALYAAAVRDLGAARGARYPTLSLSGNILAPLDGGSVTETAVAGIALPIFQQPLLAAEEDAAFARVEQAYAEWTSAVLSAVEDVESALAAIQGSHLSAVHAGRLVSLNSEAHNLVREQLSIGSATVLELLDSERETTRARGSISRYKRDQALALIALYRALGVGVPS